MPITKLGRICFNVNSLREAPQDTMQYIHEVLKSYLTDNRNSGCVELVVEHGGGTEFYERDHATED